MSLRRHCPRCCLATETYAWDREPLPWLKSACRVLAPPPNASQYRPDTVSGDVWHEERFDADFQRHHRLRPLSQYSCFQTTYKNSYDKHNMPTLPDTLNGDVLPVYPGHQPNLDSAKGKAQYSAPTSTYRIEFMDPQLRLQKLNPCFCHSPVRVCPLLPKPNANGRRNRRMHRF